LAQRRKSAPVDEVDSFERFCGGLDGSRLDGDCEATGSLLSRDSDATPARRLRAANASPWLRLSDCCTTVSRHLRDWDAALRIDEFGRRRVIPQGKANQFQQLKTTRQAVAVCGSGLTALSDRWSIRQRLLMGG
jgi:hypothetical protein